MPDLINQLAKKNIFTQQLTPLDGYKRDNFFFLKPSYNPGELIMQDNVDLGKETVITNKDLLPTD